MLLSVLIEEVVACLEFTAAVHQFQRSQPTQGIVESAAVCFVPGQRGDFLFVQPRRIGLGERVQNQSLRVSQPVTPVIDELGPPVGSGSHDPSA